MLRTSMNRAIHILFTKLSKMSVNNSLKFGIGLFLSLFLIVSCQKEQTVLPQVDETSQKILPHLEGVELVENRLVFESETAYENAQNLLREKGIDEGAIVKNQFPDFISMEDAYNNISEEERLRIGEERDLTGYENIVRFERGEDGEVSASLNTGIFESRLLVNPQGIIQIGDDFRKIEFINTYKLSKNQYDAFISEGEISAYITKEPNNIIILGETGMNNSTATDRASKVCTHNTDGSNKRVKGIVYYTSDVIEVKSKHQKKVGWIWWSNQANWLAFNGNATWTNSALGPQSWSLPWNAPFQCFNCNQTSEAIFNGGFIGRSASNISFEMFHGAGSGTASGWCVSRRNW